MHALAPHMSTPLLPLATLSSPSQDGAFTYSVGSLPNLNMQVTRCVTNAGSDFYSGVTAALITRSGNPTWVPASLKDVSCAVVCPLWLVGIWLL